MAAFPVTFVARRESRTSVLAAMAVLEQGLPPGTIALRLAEGVEDLDGTGLAAFSFLSADAPRVAARMERLRRRHPTLPTIAGGCHASAMPEATLAMGFSWVCVGEAGPAFAALVRDLAAGRRPPSGLLPREEPQPLDLHPPWPLGPGGFSPLEITRGCPMSCAFCQTPRLFGRRPRHQSLASVRELLRRAAGEGMRYLRFVTPNAFGWGSEDGLTPVPSQVEALLRAAREAGLVEVYLGTFPSEVRPESVTLELLSLVRGLCDNRTISVGLQSGSDEVLRRLKRGHTVRQAVEAVERIAQAGLKARVDVIFGLPGETEREQATTCSVLRHLTAELGAEVHAHAFDPLPGTPLAGARPAPIAPATRAFAEDLSGRGVLTGLDEQWRRESA